MDQSSSVAKRTVAAGYDRITETYLDLVASMGRTVRDKYLAVLSAALPPGAHVLELGCGAGVPMTAALAERFRVTGLDISAGQLLAARRNVRGVDFLRGDMVALPFADSVFDATAAFYSMTHVPRVEHVRLLAEVNRVMRPGGLLILTAGTRASEDWTGPWLGVPMYFSHFDGDTTTELVGRAGFQVLTAQDEPEVEYGEPVSFRWIVARKRAQAR